MDLITQCNIAELFEGGKQGYLLRVQLADRNGTHEIRLREDGTRGNAGGSFRKEDPNESIAIAWATEILGERNVV